MSNVVQINPEATNDLRNASALYSNDGGFIVKEGFWVAQQAMIFNTIRHLTRDKQGPFHAAHSAAHRKSHYTRWANHIIHPTSELVRIQDAMAESDSVEDWLWAMHDIEEFPPNGREHELLNDLGNVDDFEFHLVDEKSAREFLEVIIGPITAANMAAWLHSFKAITQLIILFTHNLEWLCDNMCEQASPLLKTSDRVSAGIFTDKIKTMKKEVKRAEGKFASDVKHAHIMADAFDKIAAGASQ